MRRRLATAVSLAFLALSDLALPHGGVVPPDPRTPPVDAPGAGRYPPTPAPGPSGPAPAGPTVAGGTTSSVPTSGAGSTPTTPAAAGPGTGGGATPSPPATGASTGGRTALSVATGSTDSRLQDSWEVWWHFNKDPFLELKRAVAESTSTYGADDLVPTAPAGIPSRDLVQAKIVPRIARLLETERAKDVTTGALLALARIGEAPDVPSEASALPRILRALSDPNQEIAETAALALGVLRTEAAIPHLTDLLAGSGRGGKLVGSREVPSRTRAFAAYGLGLAAERTALNRTRQVIARSLFDALEDRRANADVQVAAVIALSLDPIDVEPVESRSAAWISRQTVLRHLMHVYSDPERDRLLRAHTATAIARLSEAAPAALRAEILELFLAAVSRRSKLDNEILASSIQALGVVADAGSGALDRKARSALAGVLEDADPQARFFALIALAEIGSRPPPGAGQGRQPGGPEAVANRERSPGEDECRGLLAAQILRGRSTMKPWAALALGVLERRRIDSGAPPCEPLRSVLREWFATARGRTEVGSGAIALGLCRESAAGAMLRAKLAQTNEDTGQGYVALALGMIGCVDAAPSLRAIVQGSRYRPFLLEQSAGGLALLGDSGAAPQLAALLAEARGAAAQASLAGALGFIGDVRSIEPLLVLIGRKDLSDSARGLAVAALGRIADESWLPWSASIACGLNYRACTPSLMAGNGTGVLEIL